MEGKVKNRGSASLEATLSIPLFLLAMVYLYLVFQSVLAEAVVYEAAAETAEYLGVTEEFLNDALTYYKSKYGVYVSVDNYIIMFEPNIAVAELI